MLTAKDLTVVKPLQRLTEIYRGMRCSLEAELIKDTHLSRHRPCIEEPYPELRNRSSFDIPLLVECSRSKPSIFCVSVKTDIEPPPRPSDSCDE